MCCTDQALCQRTAKNKAPQSTANSRFCVERQENTRINQERVQSSETLSQKQCTWGGGGEEGLLPKSRINSGVWQQVE